MQSRTALHGVADVGLVFLVLLIIGGDPPPDDNESHYVARLKHFWNPDWAADDFFLNTPDAHFTVVWLLGWATLWLPLPAVAWLGRLVGCGLIAWAWRRLSCQVTPVWGLAALTATLWNLGIDRGNLAGEWVVRGFEAKPLAYAFVLFALGSSLRNEWNRAWGFLGIAAAMHVLVGGWSVVLLAGVWLVAGRKETSLRSMLPGLIVGGIVSLAGVVPPLMMNAGTPPDIAAEAARIYVFERLPHHLAIWSKDAAWLAQHAGRHAVVLAWLAIVTGWAWSRHGSRDVRRLCLFAWGAVLLVGVGGAIHATLAHDPPRAAGLLRYYWYRMTDSAAPLAAAIGTGAAVVTGLRSAKPKLAGVGLAIALLLAGGYLFQETTGRLGLPPPAEKRVRDHLAWLDVCRWIRESTPPDALFITPRSNNTFTWRTNRSEVGVWKHVPQDAAGIVEWWRRMQDLHRRPGAAPDDSYGWLANPGQLGGTRLRALAAEYGADYVLGDRRHLASLPVAYRNRFYIVYDMRRVPLTTSPNPAPSSFTLPEKPLRAVTFDLDGLMVNSEDVYCQVGTQTLARRGKTFDDDLREAMMGRRAEDALRVMIDWHRLDDTVEQLTAESEILFWQIAENVLGPLPGLAELLAWLDEQRVPYGVATSGGRAYAERVLTSIGVLDRLRFLISAEDVTHGKPAPDPYLLAAERHGVAPAQMLVLEDSGTGCRSAVAAGAYTVATPNDHTRSHDFPAVALRAETLADPRIRQALRP